MKTSSRIPAPSMPGTTRKSARAMEVESAHVSLLPDGKKLIDVTMRRANNADQTQARMTLPEFDADSSSSSDDGDPGNPDDNDDHMGPQRMKEDEEEHDGDGDSDGDDEEGGEKEGNNRQRLANALGVGGLDAHALHATNAQLNEHVVELRDQIKSLQIQLEACATVPGLDVAAMQDILLDKDGMEHDIRDVKIVHQAKSLRHLKRCVMREKRIAAEAVKQCKAMEAIRLQLEQDNDTLKMQLSRVKARAAAAADPLQHQHQQQRQRQQQDEEEEGAGSDAESTTSSSSKRRGRAGKSAASAQRRYEDLKIKYDKMQSEMKKLQRALVREVGEEVPLEELVEDTSSQHKRGRAQQIIMLKAKVKKLQQSLRSANAVAGNDAVEATTLSGAMADTSNVDQRAQQEIRAIREQRQLALEQLTSERDELQVKLQQVSKKHDALRSRTQTLEKERQEGRAKLQVLVDKSRNDDALVDALHRQLETWKGKLQEAKRARTADSTSNSNSSSHGNNGGSSKLAKDERLELERLRAMVADYKQRGAASQPSVMPAVSEAAQFRALAADKERMSELVASLQIQLDDKERQLREFQQQQPIAPSQGNEHPVGSCIPRLMPSIRAPYTPTPPPPVASTQSNETMEALRKTFREAMVIKEQEVEALKRQVQSLQVQLEVHAPTTGSERSDTTSSNNNNNSNSSSHLHLQQELQDLQDENEFLRGEFDKLKTRYEAAVRATGSRKAARQPA